MDRADLLDPATARALEASLEKFERATGHQIVVHTTPSLEGLDIVSYSFEIAQAWKLGQTGRDDGVLLTIAPSERQMRIEVGYGLEGAIPDALASRIVRDTIAPAFRQGRTAEGITAGVDELMRLASGEAGPPASVQPRERGSALLSLLFLGLFLVPYLLSAFGPRDRSGRRQRIHRGFGFPGSGGFGGGGGGFSGGGGRFGGGGASGSW